MYDRNPFKQAWPSFSSLVLFLDAGLYLVGDPSVAAKVETQVRKALQEKEKVVAEFNKSPCMHLCCRGAVFYLVAMAAERLGDDACACYFADAMVKVVCSPEARCNSRHIRARAAMRKGNADEALQHLQTSAAISLTHSAPLIALLAARDCGDCAVGETIMEAALKQLPLPRG
eukprot:6452949-Prymnesium_polylepis.4